MSDVPISPKPPRLNCTQLAKVLQRPVCYVTAMRRAGYVFEYEALGRTTEDHALECLKAHPEFLANDYLTEGWQRRPKILAPTHSAPTGP